MADIPRSNPEKISVRPTERQILVEFLKLIFQALKKPFNEQKLSKDNNVLRKVVRDFSGNDKNDNIWINIWKNMKLKYPNYYKDVVNAIKGPPDKRTEAQKLKDRLKFIEDSRKKVEAYDRMSLDQLISTYPDKRQSAQWAKIKNVNWPQPKGKIKLVLLGGGVGLDKDVENEFKEIPKALKVIYKDKLQVVRIPYPWTSDARVALKKFELELQKKDNSDIIIPYISGHGRSHPDTKRWIANENSPRKDDLSKGLSSEDFKSVVAKNRNKQFLFILQTCYSGSATDDPLSREKNVFGIVAASGKEQMSVSTFFDTYLMNYINKGMRLGEAFIRADAATNKGQSINSPARQNPSAVFNIGNQRVEVD